MSGKRSLTFPDLTDCIAKLYLVEDSEMQTKIVIRLSWQSHTSTAMASRPRGSNRLPARLRQLGHVTEAVLNFDQPVS